MPDAISRREVLAGAAALAFATRSPALAQSKPDTLHVGKAVFSSFPFATLDVGMDAGIWKALNLDSKNQRFTLSVAKDALKNAPGFDKDHWPSMADSTWAGSVHKFYGTPYQRPM